MHKVGFLASRKISTLSVLPTLDWAMQICKQTDIAVVSGFHSRLEKDMFTRVSEVSAHKRNEYVMDLADEMNTSDG